MHIVRAAGAGASAAGRHGEGRQRALVRPQHPSTPSTGASDSGASSRSHSPASQHDSRDAQAAPGQSTIAQHVFGLASARWPGHSAPDPSSSSAPDESAALAEAEPSGRPSDAPVNHIRAAHAVAPGDEKTGTTSPAVGAAVTPGGGAESAMDSPVAPAADVAELPPVATYRRAIVQSLARTVGSVTGPLRQEGQSYARLLRRMVSGGELLGAVEDGELGDAAAGERQGEKGGSGAREPGAEALLALTLEAFTDVCRYPRPLAPHAAVLVAARDDAYVPVQSTEAIAARWHGSELWHAEGGHVSSFLLLNPLYLRAISRSLAKLQQGPPVPPVDTVESGRRAGHDQSLPLPGSGVNCEQARAVTAGGP
eukprot:jgi/Ulvmu1/3412/UM016_0030.1